MEKYRLEVGGSTPEEIILSRLTRSIKDGKMLVRGDGSDNSPPNNNNKQ